MAMSRKRLCVLFCGGVLLLATGGIMIPVVDMLSKSKIKDKAVIANGSEFYNNWVSPAVPVYAHFYLFNVTNPQTVKDGGKPMLTERGPYTYREARRKEGILFNPNGTVTYREKHVYFFERNMSIGDESDLITTANLPILVAAEKLQFAPVSYRGIFSTAMKNGGEDLFVTRSVKELLWGYTDDILQRLKKFRPDLVDNDFVGYFIGKNNTQSEVITIYTGRNTIENLGQIDMYGGSKYLPFWSTRWANMINGTDGAVFPPFQQYSNSVNIFSAALCRSSKAVFQTKVETKQSIALRRYVVPPSALENATGNPDNIGFCTPETKCLPTGLLNVSNCLSDGKHPVPAVASFPHFYMADPTVQRSIGGMLPVADKHQSAIDIEPWTGLVLQAYRRLQINMHMMKVEGLGLTYNVRTLYFPIFWISETTEIDNKHAGKLQRNFYAPMEITAVLEKVFMIIGGALVLIVMVVTCRNHRRQNKSQLMALAPGPVPTLASNGQRRRARRGQIKEKVPLLPEKRDSGPPPPPVPSYQRPPLDNGHRPKHSVTATMEPTYQTTLDA